MDRTTSFLGLGQTKDTRPLLEEHGASCAEAALFLPTSSILRPVPSKLPVQKPQFMSFKSAPEAHGDVRMPGFQSVVMPMGGGVSDANNNHRASAPTTPKNFNKCMQQQGNAYASFLNLTNKHSFPLPSHPSRGANNSVSPQVNPNVHHPAYPYGLPVVQAKGHGFVGSPQSQSPFTGHYPPATMQQQQRYVVGAPGFEAPVNCPTNVGYNTSNSSQPLPTSGQLTIFFGGMVNVYENVSLEKVQAIMSMAANGPNIIPENSNATKQVPLVNPGRVRPADPVRVRPSEAMKIRHPQPPQPANPASPYSVLCSPTSAVASPSVDHSASSSNTPEEPKATKSPVPSENKQSIEDENATGTTPMSRAVPMARKASLARFLEKRKERTLCRMSNLAPYASVQNLPDCNVGITAVKSFMETHMTKLINAPGARDQTWHPARGDNGMDANFVNTELGM